MQLGVDVSSRLTPVSFRFNEAKEFMKRQEAMYWYHFFKKEYMEEKEVKQEYVL